MRLNGKIGMKKVKKEFQRGDKTRKKKKKREKATLNEIENKKLKR